jgi:Zn-dependent protease with chaperone function
LFNLTVNAALAFVGSLLLVAVVLRLTRRLAGSWQVALLMLPFAKALWELGRGVPERSFFWLSAQGVGQDLGSFQIGVGLSGLRVQLNAALSAIVDGHAYPTSAAELFSRGMDRHGAGWLVGATGLAIVVVALLLLCRRAVGALRFERARRRARAQASALSIERLGRRMVDVYRSIEGNVPFAGGILRPYVCFPAALYDALDDDERRAVIGHELAHLRRHDVVTATVVSLLCDVLWFCPGAYSLRRWIHERIEQAADRSAVRAGISPSALASALLVASGLERSGLQPSVSLGHRRGVRARIAELVAPGASLTVSLRGWLLRITIAIVTANSVLFAVFFGNH